ncbi:Ig-like domain-containing protein [Paenibacillus cymbidii]|uniref:Ig-like domain-containing protein n=1 Tax=Paenibacillus cymbidii TaxID=1639034 RepID=UPI001080FBFD|nr:Ig-like domain-containing protein [Paenibacillus cymbidii]
MKRLCSAVLSLALVWALLLPGGKQAQASAPLRIIAPYAAGTATYSTYFPMENAFDSTDIHWDAVTGEPVGDDGAVFAPYYSDRYGYIDFGPDWADIRISSTWTKYRPYSAGNHTPYSQLWWDDDKDTTNDSGLTETRFNFNSAQSLPFLATAQWKMDTNANAVPIVPQARYLVLKSPSGMTNRASEYAIVGTSQKLVTGITVTGAGGVDSIDTYHGSLQMSAAIAPSNATDQAVTWSVEYGTGRATIDAGGLLTAVSNGIVTVRATAQDGSGVSGTKQVTLTEQGNEVLQLITPVDAGTTTGSGSQFFPMNYAFDGQPTYDANYGKPTDGAGTNDGPYYSNRYGYIDFGPDWSKVRITSTWTQYRASSVGNQTPYQELWWDNDKNIVNDSGFTEIAINFNTAQGLNTGTTTPWRKDSEVGGSPVAPKARYLILHSAASMTNRAKEYAIIGWIDANGNGIQDAPTIPVTQITVTGVGGATSVLKGETLQMTAEVFPYTATDSTYTWSVANGTGSATISSTGLLSAVTDGTVTVTATAQDGSNVVGSVVIEITKFRSYVLPVQGHNDIFFGDITKDLPDVDWENLERLYIPAGTYQYLKLDGLPKRAANKPPLIITNYGGQVKVTGIFTYSVVLGGGSNWILTGEYDSDLKTGNVNYPGHKGGDYANSPGHYGIEVGRSNTNGVSIGNYATNFELSYMEVADSGFAGLLIKTDKKPDATMDGVKIHDMYIHDTDSEGMYIGNTGATDNQHLFTNLEIYNNRVLRTGTEGIQLTNMGDGVKVHNNVVVMCATDWKSPFDLFQDGCLQYSQRSGSAEIDHNVFIGGASKTFELWFTAATGETLDPNDEVYVHDNYFSHGRSVLSYIHNMDTNYSTTLRFEDNIIRQYNYQYDELPGHTDENRLFYASHNTHNPLLFNDNVHDGSKDFIDTIGGDNAVTGNVYAAGNSTNLTLAPIVFKDITFPANFDWTLVERWDDYSDLYNMPDLSDMHIYYNEGDYVYYQPTDALYVCIEPGTHTGKNPTTNPLTWQLVSPMHDDFRSDATSPYPGIGLSQ